MTDPLKRLEVLAYRIRGKNFGTFVNDRLVPDHPFDSRNIHPEISKASKQLFDDGYYRQATLDAFICLEDQTKKVSEINDAGFRLMMSAFNENNPKIKLNSLDDDSKKNEQEGYRHIFAGAMRGIRNLRAHSIIPDTMNECLDHLSIASALMRKIDDAEKRS